MRQCRVCGGTLVGDGYMMARHCENVDLPADRECDAPVLECDELGPDYEEWSRSISMDPEPVDLFHEDR